MEPKTKTIEVNIEDEEDVVDHILALAKALKGIFQGRREDLKRAQGDLSK